VRNQLSRFFSVSSEQVFLFSKGRVGLYALLKAMGIGSGDEVLMSGYTCVMVPSAPIYLGATCRYLDIEPGSYNLNPQLLDSLYSKRTKALVVQHTYGIAQKMAPVMAWAKSHNIPVVEDCCHAFGSRDGGQLCGSFGVGTFFSGQWNKPFSTGLGGMLVVNEKSLLEPVAAVSEMARTPSKREEHLLALQIAAYRSLVTPRTVSVMTRLYRGLSSLGLVRGSSSNDEFDGVMPVDYLKKMAGSQIREGERNFALIERNIAHRKQLAEFYSKELPLIGFVPLKADASAEHVIVRYPVRVANKRAVLRQALTKGVELGSWFEIPLHPENIDMIRFGYRDGMCPESERAASEVVNLPTHLKISRDEASRVLDFLKKQAQPVSS